MIPYSPGEVVLVRFPFTDLATTKKRPALVVSPVEYGPRYHDVVVLAMTSKPQPEDELRLQNWQNAGLPKPTWLKPLIATLATDVVERSLGKLADEDWPCAVKAVECLIAPQFVEVDKR